MPHRNNGVTPALPPECPICRMQYTTGITGWDKHIGAISQHPKWHPELIDPVARKAAFVQEHPEFFGQAKTASRRVVPSNRPPRPVSGEHPAALRCPTCGAPLKFAGG